MKTVYYLKWEKTKGKENDTVDVHEGPKIVLSIC